nr:M4 family metallopeptidase [uncultured Dyadobacter sp.]
MKRKLLRFVFGLAYLLVAFEAVQAQQIYNPKNVTQDVLTTHYNDLQPVRVMEYSTDPGGNLLERRLETLPENDLPAIKIREVAENANETPFINQPPFGGLFNDGPTNFKVNVDAATLLLGTEVALKVIKDKFGWIGIDNQAVNGKPIIWNIVKPEKDAFSTAPKYGVLTEEFYYFADGEQPEKINKIDVVAHEIFHAIQNLRAGVANTLGGSSCSEVLVLREALCDIIGLYVLNEYEQNSPAFYEWTWSKGFLYSGRSFDNPNAIGQPDTYFGNYYTNACPETNDFPVHQNATVIDHWYYLLAVGTTGTETNDLGYAYTLNGIGINKAIQIVWKCVDYLSPKSDFEDLKKATLTATEQLYGLHSTEYLAVMNAWCAVGICDNNLGLFSMSPAHGTNYVNPWPGVNVNITWEGKPVKEWEVQMSTSSDFIEDVQNITIKNFTTVIKPGGGLAYSGFATGYYPPGKHVYARARIMQTDADFCKGYNPLCVLYQQFGPSHAFWLKDQQTAFWPYNNSISINPWNNPELSWKSVPDAHRYRLQVAADVDFTDLVYDKFAMHSGNFAESGIVDTPLDMGKTYYTRVRAERTNVPNILNSYGEWSNQLIINSVAPVTSILQALGQNANDPAHLVSSLGFWVGWHTYPGASNYVVQIADDPAFNNIIRSKTVAGNISTIEMLLPPVPDQTELFVRVLPQKGAAFGFCTNTWRIKTDQKATVPAMKDPIKGSAFPFKDFLGNTFTWNGGSLNLNLVDHFELHVTEKTSNLTSIFATQGKVFNFDVQDPLMFDDKQGLEVSVLAVNSLGAKSALSEPFDYTICPDHPGVSFPGDLGKVDPSKNFNIEWHPSGWFDPGSQFLVTIKQAGNVVPGFNSKPTTNLFMLVPAGTLLDGKDYTLTVENSSSCNKILLLTTFFSAKTVGGINQPQPPKLVNFNIDLKAFRNDPDAGSFPPTFGTSNYVLGIELLDPNGNVLTLVDPGLIPITQLDVDSENSGVLMAASNKPEGKHKLRLKMLNIFDPLLYYPFDQPRFSVLLNGKPVVTNHVITADFLNPASPFNEWKTGFQFADIILDIK